VLAEMVKQRSTLVLGFRIIFGILAAALISSGQSTQKEILQGSETGSV